MPLPIPRCWNTKKARRRRRRKKSPRTTSPCQRATGWGRLFFIHATPGNGTPSTSAIIAPTKENPSVPLSSKPARIHFLFRSIFSFLFFAGARVSMTVCVASRSSVADHFPERMAPTTNSLSSFLPLVWTHMCRNTVIGGRSR